MDVHPHAARAQVTSAVNDRTGIIVPPPLLYAVPFLAAWMLGRWREWRLFDVAPTVVASTLIGLGVAIAGSGIWQFKRARTTVLPLGGTSRIVEAGIYRWTRNPMYLGLAVVHAGGAVLINSAWCLAVLPLSIALIQVLVIRREARYLTRKFGAVYESYRARVHRWL
jgi:protein-S-isoprenylcysteine O-methyltransferase Ste14